MTHENLVIHPDRFEDMAVKIVCHLIDRRLIENTQEAFDQSVFIIERALNYQLWLHRNWDEDLEGLATKFRADQPNEAVNETG
jgi:hypothetical protein